MQRVVVFAAIVLLVAVSGCSGIFGPDQTQAIQMVEQLGGDFEPHEPSIAHPVYRVNLSDTEVTNEHLRFLEAFPALQSLSLNNTQVTDEGLYNLRNSRLLRRMDLTGTHVTDTGVATLQRDIPGLRVLR